MNDMAKIFWNGRSQAVRLPKEYRFVGGEVSIRREGDKVILEPVTTEDWESIDPSRRLDTDAAVDALGNDVANDIERLRALIEEGVASPDAGEWDADEIRRIARGEQAEG